MKLNLENKNLQKKPFKVPNGYFDTVENIVLAKLKAEVMNKGNTSAVPEGYFESIDNNILAEIKQPKTKVISLKSRMVKIIAPIAVAASLLLVVVLSTNKQHYTFEDLTSNDIEQFIETETITFDEVELAMVIDDEDLSEFEHSSTYSNEEILEYLNDSDIEFLNFED
jgi:hypothetical protein